MAHIPVLTPHEIDECMEKAEAKLQVEGTTYEKTFMEDEVLRKNLAEFIAQTTEAKIFLNSAPVQNVV